MRSLFGSALIAITAAFIVVVFSTGMTPTAAQDTDYRAPRTADGRPDLNGIWQVLGSAHWDIEPHAARMGPIVEMAALGSIPGGLGVVQGGEIPYTAAARAKQQENLEHWLERDPGGLSATCQGCHVPPTCRIRFR